VLTLTATPIPRTLQLASDRRARYEPDRHAAGRSPGRAHLRDAVRRRHHREALLREQYRGGQSFYVCPRIEDLAQVATELRELVPEIRMAMAHGRLAPTAIENTMQDFVDGKFDVLLSTNIVESGSTSATPTPW
jgi:Transcription-repair coupling factor (superfamily II helicase)